MSSAARRAEKRAEEDRRWERLEQEQRAAASRRATLKQNIQGLLDSGELAEVLVDILLDRETFLLVNGGPE